MDDRKKYDRLCAQIRSVLARGARRDWEVGAALNELRDSGLWKAISRSKHGRPYYGFNTFAFGEFRLGISEVARCCRIAATFTKAQVTGWDSYGINLIANVKKAALREKLLREHHPERVNDQGRSLEKKIRSLPLGSVFHQLKRNAVRGRNLNVLADLTVLMKAHPGLSMRIEAKGGEYGVLSFKALLLSKRGVEAAGVDESAPTAARNAILEFNRLKKKPKSKAA